MASFDWGAFVAGAADTTLKSWETREASDRKMAEVKMLEKLRQETSDYEFKRDNAESRKKVKRNEFDPTSGETVGYNEYGEEVGGTRRKDQASLEEYNRNKTKFDLDIENTRGQIADRKEDNEIRRQELAERRLDRAASREGSGSAFGGGGSRSNPDPYDTANELIYRYKAEVGQAAKSGNISESAIRAAAVDFVENSKNGQELQKNFLRFLGEYQSGKRKTQQRARVDRAIAEKNGGLDSL